MYIDRGKPLCEGAFFFTRMALSPSMDKRNTRDKAKGLCSTSERYVGELDVRCLSTLNRGSTIGGSLFRVMKMQHISPHYCAPLIRRIICRSAVQIAPEGRGWGVTDDTMCLHQVISHSASLLPISGKPLVRPLHGISKVYRLVVASYVTDI